MKKSPWTLTGYLNRLLPGCSLYSLSLEAKKPATLMVTSHSGSGPFYYFLPSTLVMAMGVIIKEYRFYRMFSMFSGLLKALEIIIREHKTTPRCSPGCSLSLPHICIQEPGRNDYPQIALASLYLKLTLFLLL